MKLIRATEQDFERTARFYRDAIARTAHMDTCARWVYGKHPTDAMLRGYIERGVLYLGKQDGSLVSAVAVTPQQEDYHDAQWALPLADDEVAVVHLLCVSPNGQGKGIPRDHAAGHRAQPDCGKCRDFLEYLIRDIREEMEQEKGIAARQNRV